MRIALAQTNILWEDKQANLVRAEEFVIAADAEIVLFPEMSLTGFSMHTDVTAEICQPDAEIQSRAQMDSTPDMTNQPTTGWTIEQVSPLARRHRTVKLQWTMLRSIRFPTVKNMHISGVERRFVPENSENFR